MVIYLKAGTNAGSVSSFRKWVIRSDARPSLASLYTHTSHISVSPPLEAHTYAQEPCHHRRHSHHVNLFIPVKAHVTG